jgi:D-alanyl-D-alanine carboxypeptidase (penicillin-binding protein 5/6)
MIKKICCFLLIFSMTLTPVAFADEPTSDDTQQTVSSSDTKKSVTLPEIKSETAVVMDADSGQFLYQKKKDEQKAPASITKLMTALLVFQKGANLDDEITVNASALEGTSGTTTCNLVEDEKVTVKDMLYAMLLSSANDAANVLAEYVSGTQDQFVKKMNTTAKALGCVNTNFVNPNGLDDDEQLTTAADMARIARALFDYDDFLTIIGTQSYTMNGTNKHEEDRTFDSKISFLFETSQYYDKDVIGAKTGWTSTANHTLVTFAQRDDRKLVVVNLDCPSKYQKFQDVIDVLDYSFDAFKGVTISASDLYNAAVKALKDDKDAQPDKNSFHDITVYLAPANSADSLSYTFTTGSSPTGTIVFTGPNGSSQDLVTFDYSLNKVQTSAADNAGKKKTSPFKIILRIVIILFIAWLVFYGFLIYSNRERARRKRRRERERRIREREQNQNRQDRNRY